MISFIRIDADQECDLSLDLLADASGVTVTFGWIVLAFGDHGEATGAYDQLRKAGVTCTVESQSEQ